MHTMRLPFSVFLTQLKEVLRNKTGIERTPELVNYIKTFTPEDCNHLATELHVYRDRQGTEHYQTLRKIFSKLTPAAQKIITDQREQQYRLVYQKQQPSLQPQHRTEHQRNNTASQRILPSIFGEVQKTDEIKTSNPPDESTNQTILNQTERSTFKTQVHSLMNFVFRAPSAPEGVAPSVIEPATKVSATKPLEEEKVGTPNETPTVLDEPMLQGIMKNLSQARNTSEKEVSVPKALTAKLEPFQYEALVVMKGWEEGKQAKGGLLCDDMGLGKTVDTIALICSDLEEKSRIMRRTLIVAPLNLKDQWIKEIQKKTAPGSLRIDSYYKDNREVMTAAVMKKKHVVVTTPHTVVADYKDYRDNPGKHEGVFKDGLWHRIVVDEAHLVRNYKTQTFMAIDALKAKYRWCLTGTPIQNSLNDIFSLFRFLKLENFTGSEGVRWWKENILKLYQSDDETAQIRASYELQRILKSVMLRRTKDQEFNGKPLLILPPLTVKTVEFEMSRLEEEVHLTLKTDAKKFLNSNRKYSPSKMSGILTRIRQACNHPYQILCSGYPNTQNVSCVDLNKDYDEFALDSSSVSSTAENEEDSPDANIAIPSCSVCSGEIDFTYHVQSQCHHRFCPACIEQIMSERKPTREKKYDCPVSECDKPLRIAAPNSKKITLADLEHFRISSKFLQALHILTKEKQPKQKAVVFSNFTGTLDLFGALLKREGLQWAIVDGRMKSVDRTDNIETFKTAEDCNVLLVSLTAGNVGLNLQCANMVILMDPWWNPQVEEQAICRAYRLFQTRPVTVYKLVTKDSIEKKILEIQNEKRQVATDILGKPSRNSLTYQDIQRIFS
eukprot:TRINITY_DN8971_c0_g1_i1.p1 TRINITY_DN8971_c0_g1~~TRINITY_DN8971_c0_g1_i1.p1  ORF type:complete len:838 (+),score=223.89 TRINITY_DN8971_c0_g1_i1:102-2615(+)